MRVFFDTNVLADVLAFRRPFFDEAVRAWALAESGEITGLASAVSFTDVHYVLRKLLSRGRAEESVRTLFDIFEVAVCDRAVISQAIHSGMRDFEDAVQLYSAAQAKADCFLTRNPRDFRKDIVPVRTPAEFLAAHASEDVGNGQSPAGE